MTTRRALTSTNCDSRPDGVPIDMLVLHYTGMKDAASARQRLCDPSAKVSAHYLIDEDGAIEQLVAEEARAWHAGEAFWRGNRDINGRSIGIELVNPGHEFGYRPFPRAQMAALIDLARDILGRHPIPAANVVGHSDIAPRRKQDPGELFDWPALAAAGIGAWADFSDGPQPDSASAGDMTALLAAWGYDPAPPLAPAIAAFQRHFRPRHIDGREDKETLFRLRRLLTAYPPD